MKVFVYLCLGGRREHRGLLSVRDEKTGLVVAHARSVVVNEVTFKVSQTGRQRVVDTGTKGVHAGIIGELLTMDGDLTEAGKSAFGIINPKSPWHGAYLDETRADGDRIIYNPYKFTHFVRAEDHDPIFDASMCAAIAGQGGGVFATQ